MVTHNVCSFFKYGFCKHGDFCRNYHEKRICENKSCNIFICSFRHPRNCRFFEKYKRCKFYPCAYKHEDNDTHIKTLKEENNAISQKLEKLSKDIGFLNEKEKESEEIIEKLRNVDNVIKNQDKKIEILEVKLKDANLKIVEQNREIEIITKKLRVLKEKDTKITDLENKLDELVKKVDKITSEKQTDLVDIKCEKCSFIAKNEQVLKVHIKAAHTQPQKFRCFTCDFFSPKKEELIEHNAIQWDSHRMTFYPEKKKYYLTEIEQMKSDGFTVKESYLNNVLKAKD